MQRESLLYLMAAGLFAAAAGVSVGYEGRFDVSAALLLLAALAMAYLAIRTRRRS